MEPSILMANVTPKSKLPGPPKAVSQSARLCQGQTVHKGNYLFRGMVRLTGAEKWMEGVLVDRLFDNGS
jgi:hypothetical protein